MKRPTTTADAGRKGGHARARAMTSDEREASASIAGRAAWATLTPEERSAEMRRRAAVRRARRQSSP